MRSQRAANRWWRVAMAIAALALLCLPRAAHADHEAAKQLFRAGRAAYERGDFRAAAASFEQAAQAEPHAQAWYAAGDAWANARTPDRAAYAFAQALELGGLPPKRAQEIERRLAVLRKRLGRVEISGPEGSVVAVAHVPRAKLPLHIYLEPGPHRVELVEPAHAAESKTVEVAVGKSVEVRFDYEPLPPAEPTQEPSPGPRAPVEPSPDEPSAEPAVSPAVLGWVMLGIGAASAVAGGVVTAMALDARDDWEADRRDTKLLDRAESLRTATGVTWVAAGVLLGAGATVLVVDAATDERDAPTASLRVGPQGAMLTGVW